jgi:hypothetical protein
MILRTSHCKQHKHPEFSFRIDPKKGLREDANWLVGYLEQNVASGERYMDGETVQIGWIVNLLKKRKDGTFGVLEPDFESFPINWVDSVTDTLAQFRMQNDVAESFGLNPIEFPSIRQSCVLGTDVVAGDVNLVLERTEPNEDDSGWFIGRADTSIDYSDPQNLRRASLYEAGVLTPGAIMFLALPTGYRVVLTDSSIEITFGDRELTPLPTSFLERFFLSRHET